ncbi:MAG: FGGY family carbohydrate kinase [Planctomycetota bacterium]|nr:FGGY family carbohydrate kinase [Planctomycetota bacterium]
MAEGTADLLALDVTTTEFALAVRDDQGHEDYAVVPMRGATHWQNDPAFPAFELAQVPGMLRDLLASLQARGWSFDRSGEADPGHVSIACRQHDMVLLDQANRPLLPALSWQCNAATAEVADLQQRGVEKSVGKIEPRFVLPKLACVLHRQPALREQLATVFMTGDWITQQLTGKRSLSTSDALSNGLLDQRTRKRADKVIKTAEFDVGWFPATAQSGTVVGPVTPTDGSADDAWEPLRQTLRGWQFVAGLGDNHASAVGCGMTDDYQKLVVSGGTSGTINLSCPKSASLPEDGEACRFEFYEDSLLLLLMLADCGAWYNRFVAQFAPELQQMLAELNSLTLSVELASLRRVLHDDVSHTEEFPPSWANAPLGIKVAGTQLSIGLELLLRVKRMLGEVKAAKVPAVETYVLTGGLSQSLFFQCVFHTGVKILDPQAAVKVSGRTGPLRYKTSAYGALTNAELPRVGGRLTALHAGADRFPLVDCIQPDPAPAAVLRYLLRSYGI